MISTSSTEDAAELNTLVNSAFRGDSSRKGWTTEADLFDGIRIDEERLMRLLQKPDTTILKYTDETNKIIGCVLLEKYDDKLYLGMLTVSPEVQAKGIGRKMMAAAEEEARKLNCISIYMTVITERSELIDWYLRQGYVNTGKKRPFPMDDPRFGLPKKKLEFVVLEKKLE